MPTYDASVSIAAPRESVWRVLAAVVAWPGMTLLAFAVAGYASAMLFAPELRPGPVRILFAERPVAAFRSGLSRHCLAVPGSRPAGSRMVRSIVKHGRDVAWMAVTQRFPVCDACLRIGGASAGADDMMALAKQHGKAVYFSIADASSA